MTEEQQSEEQEPQGLDILLYPNPMLLEKCDPVAEQEFGTNHLKEIVDAMTWTLFAVEGLGLAAPQVAINRRLFIKRNSDNSVTAFCNPTVDDASTEHDSMQEGCLSMPGAFAVVRRPKTVTIKAYDIDGKEFTDTYEGVDSFIVQHEIDHLDGIMFVDRLSKFQYEKMMKRLKKKKNKSESDIQIYHSIPKQK